MSALANKIAIVTGASAGIGHATALDLARHGAAVVVTARRKERLDDLVKEISAAGGKALAVQGDASVEKDIDNVVAQSVEFSRSLGQSGRLDIVIVNAGRGLSGGLLGSDPSKWNDVFKINVMGAALLMRKAGQIMVEQQSGDIVVIGSVAGHNVSPFSGFYGGSKFAIGAIAEAFRREVSSKKVRVTLVKPAILLSEFQAVAGYTQDNFYKNIEKFGKVLEPNDVARTITFILEQPPHVHINELIIRPTGQDYP